MPFSLKSRDKKLPFPTRPLKVQGGVVEEYIIPDDKRAEVLELLYLFTPVPDLDDEFLDIHEDRVFKVRDFIVTWENGYNHLVSPYYPLSGGTIIDWMPLDGEMEEDNDEEEEVCWFDDDI